MHVILLTPHEAKCRVGRGMIFLSDSVSKYFLPVQADGGQFPAAVGLFAVTVFVDGGSGFAVFVVGGLDAAGAVAVAVVFVLLGIEQVFVNGIYFFAHGASLLVVALQGAGLHHAGAVVGVGDEHRQTVVGIHHSVR